MSLQKAQEQPLDLGPLTTEAEAAVPSESLWPTRHEDDLEEEARWRAYDSRQRQMQQEPFA